MVNPRESLALTMALTRAFISLAALFVNVSARIRLAGTPSRSRYAIRLVMTRVLPVPAPARIKSGPCVVLTAESCGPADGLCLFERDFQGGAPKRSYQALLA